MCPNLVLLCHVSYQPVSPEFFNTVPPASQSATCRDTAQLPGYPPALCAHCCSVQNWWLNSDGKQRCGSAAMKVLPYGTPQEMRLFDREVANLKSFLIRKEGCYRRTEPFAPAFLDAFREPAGVPIRHACLIMRYTRLHWTSLQSVYLWCTHACMMGLLCSLFSRGEFVRTGV